jgi:CheY-like chemotaxis protein
MFNNRHQQNKEYNKTTSVVKSSILAQPATIIAFIHTVICSVLFFTNHNLISGFLFLIFGFFEASLFFLLSKAKYKTIVEWLGGTLNIFYPLFLLYIGGTGCSNGGFYWLFLLPIYTIAYFNFQKSLIATISCLIFASLFLFIPLNLPFSYSYSTNHALFLILSTLTTWILVFITNNKEQEEEYAWKKEKKQIEDELKSKEEFISRWSYQIRIPLNNILVIGEVLNNTKLDDNQKDLVETLWASTNNLVNVVNDIGRISKTELTEKSIKLNFDFFAAIRSTFKLLADNTHGLLNVELQHETNIKPLILGDSVRLKQIILNLIDNLYKAGQEKNLPVNINIRISIQKETQDSFDFKVDMFANVEVDYTNDKQNFQKSIFFDDISIARKLIEFEGSSLNIEKQEKSTFLSFNLKYQKADIEQDFGSNERSTSIITESSDIQLKDANVLLVEDNLVNQKIVILSLKKTVKNIDIASDGKEALDKFGSSKYDIILMDIQMPIMDGLTATRKIREIEASTTNTMTPIIALTANALSGDKETCLAAGMNDYISKPFQIETLVRKMNDLIQKRKS